MVMDLRPGCEVAQPFCDDVVLVAGSFKPNAPGRSELSGLRAMSERQLLKSRGAYFAERVLVAVTPIDVVAVALGAASLIRARRLVWSRSQLRAERVPSRAQKCGPSGPALLLTRWGGPPRLEVAPLADDQASWAVIDRLLGENPRGHDRI